MSRKQRRTPAGRFYAPALTDDERAALEVAAGRPLLDEEIDVLRVLIRRTLDPDGGAPNIVLAGRLIETLGRLLRARQIVTGSRRESPADVLARLGIDVLKELGATDVDAKDPGAPT